VVLKIYTFVYSMPHCSTFVAAVDHVVLRCPIRGPPHRLHGLTVLDDETIEWLLDTCHEISAAYSSSG